MDSYREHPSDFDPRRRSNRRRRRRRRGDRHPTSGGCTSAPTITGSRCCGGRDYPSIEDLEPGEVSDFAANSVLLDFTAGRDNPATPYIGAAIREECGLDEDVQSITDRCRAGSLLSRLTDHYLQIIANRAPIGFEAEFVNQRGETICYRGILMPFSSDGDTIDFIYGVINWKAAPKAQIAAASRPSAVESPTTNSGLR